MLIEQYVTVNITLPMQTLCTFVRVQMCFDVFFTSPNVTTRFSILCERQLVIGIPVCAGKTENNLPAYNVEWLPIHLQGRQFTLYRQGKQLVTSLLTDFPPFTVWEIFGALQFFQSIPAYMICVLVFKMCFCLKLENSELLRRYFLLAL